MTVGPGVGGRVVTDGALDGVVSRGVGLAGVGGAPGTQDTVRIRIRMVKRTYLTNKNLLLRRGAGFRTVIYRALAL